MNRTQRIMPAFAFFFSAMAVWLAAVQAQAADSAASKPGEGSVTDYMLSYLVVVLGIVLGLLVVAKASSRRDRARPSGYVEKNIMADD